MDKKAEQETKINFLMITIGIMVGALLMFYISYTKEYEERLWISFLIVCLIGLIILFIVYLIFFFLRYTIISRKKLSKLELLEKNE